MLSPNVRQDRNDMVEDMQPVLYLNVIEMRSWSHESGESVIPVVISGVYEVFDSQAVLNLFNLQNIIRVYSAITDLM